MFKHNNKTTEKYFTDGVAGGISSALMAGPAFLVALIHGWMRITILLAICFFAYYGMKKLAASHFANDQSNRSEFWWLGALIGALFAFIFSWIGFLGLGSPQ